MLNLENTNVTPGTTPQDPGFDAFINYVAIRDPGNNEPATYNGYPFLPLWWQTATSSDNWATYTTSNFWLCANNTNASMIWWKMVFDSNILSVVKDQGWQINTNRNYSQRSNPSFGVSYSPNSSNDTVVTVTIGLSSTVLTPCSVNFQVNTGGGYITVATVGLSGITANETTPATIIVPAGASYQLISVSGSPTINSIYELTQ